MTWIHSFCFFFRLIAQTTLFVLMYIISVLISIIIYMTDCVEDTNHDPLSAPTPQTPGSADPKLDKKKPNENVCLADNSLLVDISDALSEKEKVKFTVHTKTTLPEFQKSEFIVVRQHEEFVWLHDRYEENEEYAGYIIPPAPPRPDFDAEYLATFKKTVAMHEVFLQRLAAHPVFRNDSHLRVFLEYEQDLCAKPRGRMDLIGGLKIEGRMASDQDLKLADTLRYYMRDAHAAKAVLVRRLRCLAAYEAANRNLEKARAKNKDVHAPLEVQEAEQAQADACARFEQLSARAREEIIDFRTRRVAAFKKSLLDLAELEIKHARSQQELFRKSLQVLKEC
ncbi:hypothetical protein B5X24_HaOG204692 [Helicoverpa armigera]|uniref:PX domain-containing protein n=1 Tax=Helicoverpa armigera TaxID=29058 RepID=A0A2W1BXB3_HELAM|nr:hypothetical protein B5X24_HaOG204692 [Helicoverpa armigera]